MTPAELTTYLRRQRYTFGNESALQLSIAEALERSGLEFEREARLSRTDRIDFLVKGGIGIEAKVRYPGRAIYRQLVRYAEVEQITALVLMSATALGLPPSINGKPLFYVSIGRTAL
jgi:hypothetical protein